MSIIKDILLEEKERLEKLSCAYKKEIANLPRGYISVKSISGNRYAYRNYREKNKVKSVYLGKPGSEKVRNIEAAIKERKNFENLLRLAKENLKELERAIRR